ncbi:type VI secretion system baseplate subunit TssK [Cognatiyoonia sp. IB215182]|uniref:type VI secretion system baseplate subunit TssK n=1 Tax=Cognatiyoonia sp. IB215182 TaxID=3097353 RepID=UPI002A133C4E|nr:type VI secretion system baseplate subunit TssK [Cognatiyoonia sp. IB215182]MDX8355181.1 type VI secretion system baseplate subunit TssK [Cognatiyoonia sp. IB215182]
MTSGSIVWSEGMFIAPQHFQHMDLAHQRYANELAQLDVTSGDYGVSELEFDVEALNVGKVVVREGAGVFPDRLFFRLAKGLALDVPDGVVEETVFLSVPLAIRGEAQFGSHDVPVRMVKHRDSLRDLNDPRNDAVEAELAEVGACLRLGSADFSGYAAIPIARILEKTAEGRVVLDRSFIPHVLCLRASKLLTERVEEMISLARARAANAAGRVAAETDTLSEASLLAERLELQVLNRWLLVLQNEAHTGMIGPRRLFLTLASMTVELDAILGSAVDDDLIFDPEQMTACFDGLLSSLRRKLTLEKPANVVALSWNTELFEKRRVLRVIVPAKLLQQGRRPVLALRGPDKAEALAQLGPLACKLAGLSAMPELVARGLPGVDLTLMPMAPSELRSRADAAYFSINTSSEQWRRFLEKREALALHVDDRIRSVEATLYMLE